jgi:hypothetical protein
MSIPWLTVLLPLVGLVTYLLLPVLVQPVRIAFACLLMALPVVVTIALQSRQTMTPREKSPDTFDRYATSDGHTDTPQDPTLDPRQVAYVTFQRNSKEDHDFLDQILQNEYQASQPRGKPASTRVPNIRKVGIIGSGDEPVLRAELVINTAEGKRPEAGNRHETFKRPELVRSRQ